MKKVLLLCAGILVLLFGFRRYLQPRFHDLTVELGTETLTARDFAEENTNLKKIRFVTDPGSIDLGKVGRQELTLSCGARQETVTLTVTDTTAPVASIPKTRQVPVNELPDAAELAENIQDFSEVKVYYRQEPVVPLDYRDIDVTVALEDAYGNTLEQDCRFQFLWLRPEVTLELGQPLNSATLLYNPQRDSFLLSQTELNRIKAQGVGQYTVEATLENQTQSCRILVQDTTGPELELKEVQRRYYRKLQAKDFVASATDVSGIREIRLLSDVDIREKGKFPVILEAEDNFGNVTRGETVLWISSDYVLPVIRGTMSDITLEKGQPLPDLLEGITATDNKDGAIPVECDTSALDPNAGGTYYITYRATDSSGNVSTKKRKVTVIHDAADTEALVYAIADKLGNDPVAIRRYMLNTISYNHDWGGEDPLWQGFTLRRGNCYVHALCMKAVLDVKGIENQLIWVTDKSHYWLIVKADGKWTHMDPTPTRTPLPDTMNDLKRRSTLSGRKWDTTQWPSCG